VALVFTWVVLSVAFAIALYGLSLFLQAYLYSEPAEQLVLRAAVAGMVVGSFLTAWVYVNTRADRENKYGAIHQFSPDARSEVNAFEAVAKRQTGGGQVVEQTDEYRRPAGERGQRYVSVTTGLPFKLNSADHITAAVIVKEGMPAPVRFDAVLRADGWTYDGEKKTFRETGGARYIEADEPGVILAPSGGVQAAALALNALLFVVLFVVFWPVLRFGVGHAVGLAGVIGLAVVLVLMPLLFSLNKPKPGLLTVPTGPTPVTSPR
jgi:hypothetical protein